MYASVAF
jgi:hypothetical protein